MAAEYPAMTNYLYMTYNGQVCMVYHYYDQRLYMRRNIKGVNRPLFSKQALNTVVNMYEQ